MHSLNFHFLPKSGPLCCCMVEKQYFNLPVHSIDFVAYKKHFIFTVFPLPETCIDGRGDPFRGGSVTGYHAHFLVLMKRICWACSVMTLTVWWNSSLSICAACLGQYSCRYSCKIVNNCASEFIYALVSLAVLW